MQQLQQQLQQQQSQQQSQQQLQQQLQQQQQQQLQQQQQQQQNGVMLAQLSAGNANGQGNASPTAIGGFKINAASAPNPAGLSLGQQFGQLFGNATAVQGPAAGQNLPLPPPPPSQGEVPAPQAQACQGNGAISQLMVSLQAQLQTGVQSAPAQAFAPFASPGNPGVGGPAGPAASGGLASSNDGLAGLAKDANVDLLAVMAVSLVYSLKLAACGC